MRPHRLRQRQQGTKQNAECLPDSRILQRLPPRSVNMMTPTQFALPGSLSHTFRFGAFFFIKFLSNPSATGDSATIDSSRPKPNLRPRQMRAPPGTGRASGGKLLMAVLSWFLLMRVATTHRRSFFESPDPNPCRSLQITSRDQLSGMRLCVGSAERPLRPSPAAFRLAWAIRRTFIERLLVSKGYSSQTLQSAPGVSHVLNVFLAAPERTH